MIIYKTTNNINDKIYVGQDAINDPSYFGSGLILERAIKKYGIHNFRKEILEHCSSKQQLNEREIFWIAILDSTNRCKGYNIAKGGSGGNVFGQLSPSRQQQCIAKRNSTRPLWDTPEYRKKISESSKKLWENPHHRLHMKKVMTGRVITWKQKIGEANKRFWDEHGDVRSEKSKQRAAAITSQKMKGYEFKSIPLEMESKIIELYQTRGPRLIEQETGISRYLIVRLLKKRGIYQKWQKGIGEKNRKLASISKQGSKNPMFKHSA